MRDEREDLEEDENSCDYIHDVPLGVSTIEDMSFELSSRDRAHILICWNENDENLVFTNLDPRSLHRAVSDFNRAFESSRVDVRLLRSKPRGQSLAVAAVIALSAITLVAAAVYFFAAVK